MAATSTGDKDENKISLSGTKTGAKQSQPDAIPSFAFYMPAPQWRRMPTSRRPRHYWSELSNVRDELSHFWRSLGVESSDPPTIPNETLLNHAQRHDLRHAIVAMGGREALSFALGGARIMHGQWAKAVETCPELQCILARQDQEGKESNEPAVKEPQNDVLPTLAQVRNKARTTRTSFPHNRKPTNYWTEQVMIQELYSYLQEQSEKWNRPAVWMPRPAELSAQGLSDLQRAMGKKLGGYRRVQQMAGLIPRQEWFYFESTLELVLLLQSYFEETASDDAERIFPRLVDLRANGDKYSRLVCLIVQLGGRKWVALRLGIPMQGQRERQTSKRQTPEAEEDMCFGPEMSLDFTFRLLMFVRNRMMKQSPPLAEKELAIFMPTAEELGACGEEGRMLANEVELYGGYEIVARRLQLEFRTTEEDDGD